MERFDIIGALVRRGCLEMIATKILERLSLVDLLRAQGKREKERGHYCYHCKTVASDALRSF